MRHTRDTYLVGGGEIGGESFEVLEGRIGELGGTREATPLSGL
jgi:hypothetical protein